MKVQISKDKLPQKDNEVYEFIYSYFPDHKVDNLKCKENFWKIELSKQLFNHCENIIDGLNWLNITEKECPMYFQLGDNFFFCLSEALIPYGWSDFFHKKNISCNEKITLLHLDSHQDLMKTRINLSNKNYWQDLITKKKIDFSSPNSILSAIDSGAIGIGSMVTPLTHFLPFLQMVHYNPQAKEDNSYLLEPITIADDILVNNARVLANKLTSSKKEWNYFESNSIKNIMNKCDKDHYILLHIDMDSFNNRYNGDSDWCSHCGYNPDIFEQFEKIDELTELLSKNCLVDKIVHTSIGVSPSFYPTIYWEPVLKYLITKLINIGIDITGLKKKLFPCHSIYLNNNFHTIISLIASKKKKIETNKKNHFWHVYYKSKTAGKVIIDHDGKEATINVHLNKEHQGQGIGKFVFLLACKMSSHDIVYAYMRKNNLASKKAAEAAGFFEIPINKKNAQRKMIWIRT